MLAFGPCAAVLARLSVLAVVLEAGGKGGRIAAIAFLRPLERGLTVRP